MLWVKYFIFNFCLIILLKKEFIKIKFLNLILFNNLI